jgi:hypothetical protein
MVNGTVLKEGFVDTPVGFRVTWDEVRKKYAFSFEWFLREKGNDRITQ